MNKLSIGVIVLLGLLSVCPISHADTFAFDFYVAGGGTAGGGVFDTLPFEGPNGDEGDYPLSALYGELNGDPMTLAGGALGADFHFDEFEPDQFDFLVDGILYSIFQVDGGPLAGYVLALGDEQDASDEVEINFTLTQLSSSPISTPEPSALVLLLVGFSVMFTLGSVRSQIRDLRKFITESMANVRKLLAGPHTHIAAARMALADHVNEIVRSPGDGRAMRYRKALGD
jgi:hypothetical protein